jgi:CheY-like chemotaxis protein
VKILIAEDNKVNQKVLKRMLETLGYTDISVSWNGQEAVDAVKDSWEKYLVNPTAGRFDIVLMDCLMPVMNGWSATEAIRNLEDEYLTRAEALSGESPTYLEAQPTIVLALTANATEEDKSRCSKCGMDGFYVKPITRDGLNSMMLYWVSKLFADASSQPSSENNSPRDREGVWE